MKQFILSVSPYAIALVAILSLGPFLVRGLKWIDATMRALRNFLDDWLGELERPGVPRRPGVMERLKTIEDDMAVVKNQVVANGGTSMHDKVNKSLAKIEQIEEHTK